MGATRHDSHAALMGGHHEIAEWILHNDRDKDDTVEFLLQTPCLYHRGDTSYTSLHIAVMHGHMHLVEWLLDLGVDVNIVNNFGMTPVWSACHYGHLDILKYLVSRGGDVSKQDMAHRTPFFAACMNRHIHILDHLWDIICRADIYRRSNDDEAPMILCLARYDWFEPTPENAYSGRELAEWLFEKGGISVISSKAEPWFEYDQDDMDTRSTDRLGNTVMMAAAMSRDLNICEWVYEHGGHTDVNTPGRHDSTAFETAINYELFEVAEWLYEHGAEECVTRLQEGTTSTLARACRCVELRLTGSL